MNRSGIRLSIRNFSAVILVGGAGTRFGDNLKSKYLIGGKSIIERELDVLSKIFDEILLVTNSPEEFAGFSLYRVIKDVFPGAGPLGGIHAAMINSARTSLFVFAGDMPFLSSNLILDQMAFAGGQDTDAVIPEINSEKEPLHGIYMRHLSGKLGNYLSCSRDLSVRGFLGTINVSYYEPGISDEIVKAFVNINTPRDAKRYK